jgi:hypothetical protein
MSPKSGQGLGRRTLEAVSAACVLTQIGFGELTPG